MEFLTRKILPLGLLLLLPISTALSSHHSWKMQEVFSNADGTLQFEEMGSDADNHDKISCCKVVAGDKTTGVDTGYDFPSNIATGATNGKSLLLATSGFEAAYGIKPDYIIPDGFLATGPGDVFYNDTLSWDSLPTNGGFLQRRGIVGCDTEGLRWH